MKRRCQAHEEDSGKFLIDSRKFVEVLKGKRVRRALKDRKRMKGHEKALGILESAPKQAEKVINSHGLARSPHSALPRRGEEHPTTVQAAQGCFEHVIRSDFVHCIPSHCLLATFTEFRVSTLACFKSAGTARSRHRRVDSDNNSHSSREVDPDNSDYLPAHPSLFHHRQMHRRK